MVLSFLTPNRAGAGLHPPPYRLIYRVWRFTVVNRQRGYGVRGADIRMRP
jgi:hypothetical protein